MNSFQLRLDVLFCLLVAMFIYWEECNAVVPQEMTLLDLSHSTVLTSPLQPGSAIPDYTRPSTCVVTLGASMSWILIDIGYIAAGLSQVRLYSDYLREDGHEYLSNIEVDLAEYLPPSITRNFNPYRKGTFKRCDSTGTVSQHTSNAVIDCSSPTSARWVLLKRNGTLNLCFIQILQNTVKPECFRQVMNGGTSFRKAKEQLAVFRSFKFITSLNCLRNCDKEIHCDAVAFISHRDGVGMCLLLRSRLTQKQFLCDDSCEMRINLCHIGERTLVQEFHNEAMMSIRSPETESYALSLEVNGFINCTKDNCGRMSMFIQGTNGTVHQCGTIDPRSYRVMIRVMILCDIPIKSPHNLTLQLDYKDDQEVYNISSIYMRVANEMSLSLYQQTSQSTLAVGHTISTSTLSSPSFTTSSIHSVNITTHTTTSTSTDDQTKAFDHFGSPIKRIFSGIPSDTNPYPTVVTANDKVVQSTTVITHRYMQSLRHGRKKQQQTLEGVTSAVKEELSARDKMKKWSTESMKWAAKRKLTQGQAMPPSVIQNNSIGKGATDNATMNSLLATSGRREAPFLWLILLIFVSVLLLVTSVVVLISFVEGKRHKKNWDIPAGGFCPQDNGSELVTMATSLQMSTIR